MPRIPVYEQQVVPSQAYNPGRASYEGQGQGLQALGEGVLQVAGALQERKLAREEQDGRLWASKAASQADLDTFQFMQELQSSAPPGAGDFVPSYLKRFDEYAAGAVKNAPNEYAKRALQAHLAQTREVYGRQAIMWQAGESTRYRGQQIDEGVDLSAKLVQQQPDLAERELGKWGSTIEALDIPAEAKAKLRDQARKKVAFNAVQGRIDADPAGWKPSGAMWNMLTSEEQDRALAYSKQKRDESDREAKARLAETQASSFVTVARDVVDTMGVDPDGYIDLPAAQAAAVERARKAGTITNADDQMRLEGYVAQIAGYKERDLKRAQANTLSSLYDDLEQNGGDFQAVLSNRAADINFLSRDDRMRVMNYAGEVATGGLRATDWQVYGQLIDDPVLLRDTDLGALRDKLNREQYQQLVRLQGALQNEPQAEQNIRSTSAVVKELMADAGVKKADDINQFHSMLQLAVDDELAASGKKQLPQSRVKELAASLLTDVVTSRGVLWDSSSKAFAITVPSDERAKIEAALQADGLPVNDYTVMMAYRNKLESANAQ